MQWVNPSGFPWWVMVGGPAQSFRPFFFSGGRPKLLKLLKDKKTDRQRTKRGSFFDNTIIAIANARNFDGNPQPPWVIGSKIGDGHGTLNQFQRALTIAIFCFCRSAHLASKKMHLHRIFVFSSHQQLINALPSLHALSPPLRSKGWQILASQGAAPAPPLQGG